MKQCHQLPKVVHNKSLAINQWLWVVLCISFFVCDLFVVSYEQRFVLLRKCSMQMLFILSFFNIGGAMEFIGWLLADIINGCREFFLI